MTLHNYEIGGLKYYGAETEFTEAHREYLIAHPKEVLLYYDDVPRTQVLHDALRDGVVHVTMDFDRGIRSKTGFVFRIGGAQAKRTWPIF